MGSGSQNCRAPGPQMGASEGGPSCVSGPHISLLLPLLHPTQCPPMTACSWQGWCHPRPSCPLLGGSSWLPPQPPAVSHLCQGAGWGGGHEGGGLGEGKVHEVGRDALYLFIPAERKCESLAEIDYRMPLQLVLWACCPGFQVLSPWSHTLSVFGIKGGLSLLSPATSLLPLPVGHFGN